MRRLGAAISSRTPVLGARRSCARPACPRLYSSTIVPRRRAGERAVELVVDLEHRREVARRDALDLLDGDVGVVGVAPLEVVEQVGPAVHEAAHVRAHRHEQLARPARA